MKKNLFCCSVFAVLAAIALYAQKAEPVVTEYRVVDLGVLPGGNFSQAAALNNNGVIAGVATPADGTQHTVLWFEDWILDLGANLLGGPNSGAFGINGRGQILGQGESADKDPNNENFCVYGTGLKCLPFLAQDGVVTPLPLLGGNNGTVGGINNKGQAVGFAENGTRDPNCPAQPAPNGNGPQVLDFEAVIWGPGAGQIQALQPFPGDKVGMALAINDNGQVVGATGTCANTQLPGLAAGAHAVLWEQDGSVHDLGNLGGTANPAVAGMGNIALAINNQGQVVGTSALAGNGNMVHHAFLWTAGSGMKDLGTLAGDLVSAALSINDAGQMVGASVAAPGPPQGNPRAWVSQNEVPVDLNTLVPTDCPLFLLIAFGINDSGEIVGFGVQKNSPNDVHAFVAIPHETAASAENMVPLARPFDPPPDLPESARRLLLRFGMR